MAEVITGAVVGSLVENLISILRQFRLIKGVEKYVEKLSRTLLTIQAVLEYAEMNQFKNKSITVFLTKLRDAAYDAEDVLDEWCTEEAQRGEAESTSTGCTSLVSHSAMFDFGHHIFRHKIAKKLKETISTFEEIAKQKNDFHFNDNIVLHTEPQFDKKRETSSIITEPHVYGREGDKTNIIDVLLDNVNGHEDVSVCPIIGMGGLGKTTLSQLVYNDEIVISSFEVRIWVCVSEPFDVERVLKAIIEAFEKNPCDLKFLEPIQTKVGEILNGKRYLLVLDDVWNESRDEWNKLKSSLKGGAKGSSIILTTRLETVASITCTVSPYNLGVLSKEDCWSLFKDCAFRDRGIEVDPKLVPIGKEIVERCKGIPLAIKSLGSLLWSKTEEKEWELVRDCEMWNLGGGENTILSALRLSYNHLPSRLKQCFAYCSVFPKDFKMDKEELIHLWMANGFLLSDGRMQLEDLGNQIFNELLRRSFFEEIDKDEWGNISSCKIHDLMHDLACSVSVNVCSVVEVGKSDIFPQGIRHCSFVCDTSAAKSSIHQSLSKPNSAMRTQLLLYGSRMSIEPQIIFKNFHCLRALDVSGITITELPASVGKMKHLRYLNLSDTRVKLLPESICNLENLQSLKLRFCHELEMLPKSMGRMKELRHLDIKGCFKLNKMPIGMGKLTHLRTLSIFVVGRKRGRQIKELQALNSLEGELVIKGLEEVKNSGDAKEVNLKNKKNVSWLELWWSGGRDGELQEKVMEEGLQPPSRLKLLVIKGYQGVNVPSWMTLLLNLVRISIDECPNCTSLPALGQLPLLKILNISRMSSLKCIGPDFYGKEAKCFPSLKKLWISEMPDLEEWLSRPSSVENPRDASFPSLKLLSITECPKFTAFPFLHPSHVLFPSLGTLDIWYCPKLTSFPFSPSLKLLHLRCCNEMILRSVGNCTPNCLSSLIIEEFEELISLPKGIFVNLTALKSLSIERCDMLKSIPEEIENLTALTSLEIEDCTELVSLPEGGLQNLVSLITLSLKYCDNIKMMGIQGRFNSLLYLEIEQCSNLSSFSDGLRHLTSLKELTISYCPELELSREGLGFQHLISLQTIFLRGLPKLRALPDGMQHLIMLQELTIIRCKNLTRLPEWLNQLHALQSLSIINCHEELHRRCDKDNGEDWHIVSHIPKLQNRLHQEESSTSSTVGVLKKFISGCFTNTIDN